MSRRAALKLSGLLLPLAVGVLALHLAGAGFPERASRALAGNRYQSFDHGAFRVMALRGSGYHELVPRTLEPFTGEVLEAFGEILGLRRPDPVRERIAVHLLQSRDDLGVPGLAFEANRGAFLPAGLEIAIEVGNYKALDPRRDAVALRHHMVHALLRHSAPRAEWSAWVAEGLAGFLEGGSPAPASPRGGDLAAALAARPGDFTGRDGAAAAARARSLVGFLLQSPDYREPFLGYLVAERADGPVRPGTFEEILGEPAAVERDWRAWAPGK